MSDEQLGRGILLPPTDDEGNNSDEGGPPVEGGRAGILAEAAGRIILAHIDQKGTLKVQINSRFANYLGTSREMKKFQIANKANKKIAELTKQGPREKMMDSLVLSVSTNIDSGNPPISRLYKAVEILDRKVDTLSHLATEYQRESVILKDSLTEVYNTTETDRSSLNIFITHIDAMESNFLRSMDDQAEIAAMMTKIQGGIQAFEIERPAPALDASLNQGMDTGGQGKVTGGM